MIILSPIVRSKGLKEIQDQIINYLRNIAPISRRRYIHSNYKGSKIFICVSPSIINFAFCFVFRLMGFQSVMFIHSVEGNFKRRLFAVLKPVVYKLPSYLTVFSLSDQISLQRYVSSEKIFVSPMINYGDRLLRFEKKRSSEPFALFIGYVRKSKGIEFLLNNYPHDALDLVIAGKWIDCKPPDVLPNNIKIINKLLTEEEYSELIYDSSYGILPYNEITESGVLHQFISANKCVVASDIEGFRKVWKNSFGILYKKGDTQAFKLAVSEILDKTLTIEDVVAFQNERGVHRLVTSIVENLK